MAAESPQLWGLDADRSAGQLDLLRIRLEAVVGSLATMVLHAEDVEVKLTIGEQLVVIVGAIDALWVRLRELLAEPGQLFVSYDADGPAADAVASLRGTATAAVDLAPKLDPVLDGRSVLLLHALADRVAAAADQMAAVANQIPAGAGLPRQPGRTDAFEIVDEVPRPRSHDSAPAVLAQRFHFLLMCTEIATIEECCALMIKGRGSMPWAFWTDLAVQVDDEVRHARACIREITDAGFAVGDFPIDLNLWQATLDQPVAVTLAIHQRMGERFGVDAARWFASQAGESALGARAAAAFGFILRDEVAHVRLGNTWIRHIEGEAATRDAEASDARRANGLAGGIQSYPLATEHYPDAGFSEDDIARMISAAGEGKNPAG